MEDERHEFDTPTQGGDGQIALPALESAEGYVASSTTAGRTGDGCSAALSTSFNESFATLLSWGEANNLIRPEDEFPFFQRHADGYGDEHQAWFDEPSNRWFKATYTNKFGLAWGHTGSATPGEYLTRLVLQNQYFGDDIHLVALVNAGGKLRVLTSQPHVAGEAASLGEIQMWFQGLGFKRLESNNCIAWYRKADNLLVADAHEGNVLRTPSGVLLAIDLNIIKPTGDMLQFAIEATGGVDGI